MVLRNIVQHAILPFSCLLTLRDNLLIGFESVKHSQIFRASKQDPIVHNEVVLMIVLNTRRVCHTSKID